MAKFKTWGSEFLQHHGGILEGLGTILRGIGEVVPIVGGPVRVLGIFAGYAGSKGQEKAAEMKQILAQLENLFTDLEKTYETLQKYDDGDRKDSRLTLEVKISLKSCVEWSEMIEKKKVPQDLLKTLEKRVESLKFAISQETLEQTVRIHQRTKVIELLTKLDKKKPWEYYEDAKYLIGQKRWMEAKTNLICYRNYVEGKTKVMTDSDDNGVKPPEKDSHLKYLAYVQDQLAAQPKADPSPILSTVPMNTINQYQKLWEKWEATYMKKS
jgi:hypothetical protein